MFQLLRVRMPLPPLPHICVCLLHYSLHPKLQALVYDILHWRKVPESDARSVPPSLSFVYNYNGLGPT